MQNSCSKFNSWNTINNCCLVRFNPESFVARHPTTQKYQEFVYTFFSANFPCNKIIKNSFKNFLDADPDDFHNLTVTSLSKYIVYIWQNVPEDPITSLYVYRVANSQWNRQMPVKHIIPDS